MSDRSKAQQRIVDIIAGLLSKTVANGCTEEEAALAAEKVHELLAAYNLSMADIQLEEGETFDTVRDNDLMTSRAGWVKGLMGEVARLYFCHYWYEHFPATWVRKNGFDANNISLLAGSHSREYVRHNFIGDRANTIVAKTMAIYLIRTVQDLCKEGAKAHPRSERVSYHHSFLNACSIRLCTRLKERRLSTQKDGIHEGTTNLPALLSTYEKANQVNDAFIQGLGIELKSRAISIQVNHSGGANDGYAAGNKIGLDQQVSGTKTAARIAP